MNTYECRHKSLPVLTIKATSTLEAGKLAADRYARIGHVVDEFAIDIVLVGAVPRSVVEDDEVTQPTSVRSWI
jgi:hypothetical protein